MTTVGSLCSGYLGLDLAVEEVFGGTLAWVSEIDLAACEVIERRAPGVPNLGDLTTLDWRTVPSVDILTAGYPCQPFSSAGKRKGVDDERHLWPFIAQGIGILRPGLVCLENVAGHLSLGFDVVTGDLSRLGYDARWCVVRASDVGACHRRSRLFVLAYPTGHKGGLCYGNRQPAAYSKCGDGLRGDHLSQPEVRRELRNESCGDPLAGGLQAMAHPPAAHSDDATGNRERPRPELGQGSLDAPNTDQQGWQGTQPARRRVVLAGSGGEPPADSTDIGRQRDGGPRRGRSGPTDGSRVDLGVYGVAIARHARSLGRIAPNPVDRKGRLSPVFVEWMMMLDEGWVTDVVHNRSKALRVLGNGVVPAQAAHALRSLL